MSTLAAPAKRALQRALPREGTQRELVRDLFQPLENEPQARPGVVLFLRGLIVFQAWLIVVLLAAAALGAVAFAPRYVYHLVVLDKQGAPERMVRMTGLDEPNLTRTAIVNFTAYVAGQVLTFGFNNADERLLMAQRLFTKDAWQRFGKAYLDKGRLGTIKTNQNILTAAATGPAVIVSDGMVQGVYQWVVQVPMVVTYQSGSKIMPVRSVLEVTLVRADTLEHVEGIAIDGWKQI